jgi:FkbM family methyltransferase
MHGKAFLSHRLFWRASRIYDPEQPAKESAVRKLRRHFEDMRDLGPRVVERIFHKPDASGYSIVETRYGSFFIRRYDTDMYALRQIFVDGEYDLDRFPQGKTIRSACDDMLQRGKTPLIIDAGANAGFASRFFAKAYPHARILAVEPDRENAAICRANTASLPQIEVVSAAVGSRPGHVSIEREDGNSWAVRTRRSQSGLPIITIGELRDRVRDSELLIVKVDIEGFERDLFAEATEWIGETCAMIVEPHDWMLPGAGSSRTLQRAILQEDREILISGNALVWVKPAR